MIGETEVPNRSLVGIKTRGELEEEDWIQWALIHDLTLEEVQHICGLYDRYWCCDPENPGNYHAEWSSGLHSPDFFDLANTLREDSDFLLNMVAARVIQEARALGSTDFTAVAGSATGTTALARRVAELTGACFIELVKGEGKEQRWPEWQDPLMSEDIVLHIEELTSTVSTPPRVRQCINAFHFDLGVSVRWEGHVIAVIDRRPIEEQTAHPYPTVDDWQLRPIFRFPARLQKPEECRMCAAGSIAVRPRQGNGWGKLKGEID